jgi:hypothetical protein
MRVYIYIYNHLCIYYHSGEKIKPWLWKEVTKDQHCCCFHHCFFRALCLNLSNIQEPVGCSEKCQQVKTYHQALVCFKQANPFISKWDKECRFFVTPGLVLNKKKGTTGEIMHRYGRTTIQEKGREVSVEASRLLLPLRVRVLHSLD